MLKWLSSLGKSVGRKFKVGVGHVRITNTLLPVDRAAGSLVGRNIVFDYGDIIPPTAPTLGTPTVTGPSTMTVPLQAQATDASGIASYSLERATATNGPWTVMASGLSIFPYSATGLTASTTYYWRARATDTFGNVGPYSALVNATTQAAQTGAVMNTRFAGVSLQRISGFPSYRVTGTDSVTGQVFSTTSPRLWGGTEWREPQIQVADTESNWTHELRTGVNGPGGTNNETTLRITRLNAFTGGANQSPYHIYPRCTLAQMGMVYVRLKARLTSSPTSGFLLLSEYKTRVGSEAGDSKVQVSASQEGAGFGWTLVVATSLSNSDTNSPAVWQGRQSDPVADSVLFNGNRHYFRGVFEDYAPAATAPNHDWTRWFTLEFAFRPHSHSTGQVAGNAAQGWTWVATGLGTTTAAVANNSLQKRFYIAGSNLYHPLVADGTNEAGFLFPWNHYGTGFTQNNGYEIGSVEVYDQWPADATPTRPAGAV
jgi:hypothetical protein